MTYHMVHVQPPGDEPSQLWIANTPQDEAVAAVRRKVADGCKIELSGGDISADLASGLDLADGEIREFDDVSNELRRASVPQPPPDV